MLGKLTIFSKILIIIILLIVPIALLHTASVKVSNRVVEDEIISSNINRQSFFLRQLESVNEQIWSAAFLTMQDPNAIRLQLDSIRDLTYEALSTRQELGDRLKQTSNSLAWTNEMTIYSPVTGAFVTTSARSNYERSDFEHLNYTWTYRRLNLRGIEQYYFTRELTKPFTVSGHLEDGTGLILQMAVPANNFAVLLDQLKQGSSGEPLLYHQGYGPIASNESEPARVERFAEVLDGRSLSDSGHEIVKVDGENQLLIYEKSESLGWYLVDFIPLEAIMSPIHKTMILFYLATILLLFIGIALAALIYQNVQRPITQLIQGIRRVRRGEYSFRPPSRIKQYEFQFLFSQFHSMSAEIRELIEKVYFEQIKVKEATLKQLQSQINPHFLYNNFAFIQSMAQMDNKGAIIAFTQHLGRYYRYTTRTEQRDVELGEELTLVRDYLEIMKMQKGNLEYDMDIPEDILQVRTPRLLVQPLVENAIVHGIENRLGGGKIRIGGFRSDGVYVITVEDNGKGVKKEELAALYNSLNDNEGKENGWGIRNVHQRLVHFYGGQSGLTFTESALGGLCVRMRIDLIEMLPAAGDN
ncbi:sensor histidine kinase [Paenibacillus macerans]|uniref:sensor histidine kinase n=1 Tax=Paenibacillus macerans TaxID=44252 RepID=UPI003D312A55